LTHGAKFFTAGAPPAVSALISKLEGETVQTAPAGGANDRYHAVIRPVLEQKCYGCHGSEKQKGHFRLDDREQALKGGESGQTAIVPGDPLNSYLVKLILLPSDDDDVMPPEGKEPLTPEEMLAVIHWIREGAPFGSPQPPTK
ncbi:MAG: hypothetical protein KIT22_08390, partial [Verrucomicrobiae bacterium]|nr:hypothetical protein [Verrucomicrobiae bacterium]